MMPNMNSRQMKQAMKRMGINQEQLAASEVIIRLDDKDLIIHNPDVAKVNMMGQETFQIMGEVTEQLRDNSPTIDEEDIKTVMDQTGANEEEAAEAINQAEGDLAQAIMILKEEHE